MSVIDEFKAAKTLILAARPEDIARKADLGNQLAFVYAPKLLGNIQELLAAISEDIFGLLPDSRMREIVNNLNVIRSILDQIGFFQAEQGPAQKQNLENQFVNVYAAAFPALMEAVASSVALSRNNSLTRQANELKVEFDSRLAELDSILHTTLPPFLESARKGAADMEKLVEETRTRAAETISVRDAEYFSVSASSYASSASKWLSITVGSVAVLLVFSVVALLFVMGKEYDELTSSQLAQIIVGKLVILGVIGYFANLGARNYFAAKHNEAVNKHRENAIRSYRALVEATGSPEHRDIILTQAAAAVFAPQDTAYVKSAPSSADLPATIINNLPKALSGS